MADKIDSNLTGLAIAEEEALGVLPTTPVWRPLEPNSYSDFGGQIATVARNPINPSRQRKKGVTTDLDASGGFNSDLTFSNLTKEMQGFAFASWREQTSNLPLNGTQVPCTSVVASSDKYMFGADPGTYIASDLILASGFTLAANNGLKLVVSTDADDVTVGDGLADETPPAGAKLELVGHQFAAGDLSVALNGNLVRLVSAAVTMTSLPLLPGAWVYVGGDAALTHFDTNAGGLARVKAVTATYVELDKTDWEGATEAGGSKTIQLFYSSTLKNESNPDLIVRRTYQIERTVGKDANGTMSEYLVGAVANELTLNVAQADKVNVDLAYIAINNEQRNGTQGVKSGTRLTNASESMYNTSSDFSRIKLALVSPTDSSPVPLFAYSTELTLTINNNVTPNKAIGVLGAFDTSAGTFEVDGSITAYFADIEAVQAVRNNADVTLDFAVVKDRKGLVFDIPLLALGDGRLGVEQDQAIMIPLENNAAESSFGHTLLIGRFPYLPLTAED